MENEFIKIIDFHKCNSLNHLKEELEKIILKGGEGLMLRKPKSLYSFGRSNFLLKVKKKFDCVVKFIQTSFSGISFDCLLPSGIKEKIKCEMSDNNHPPLSGDILTVTHFGYRSSGTLKFPYFSRIRFDINWDQVIQLYNDQIKLILQKIIFHEIYRKTPNFNTARKLACKTLVMH